MSPNDLLSQMPHDPRILLQLLLGCASYVGASLLKALGQGWGAIKELYTLQLLLHNWKVNT